MFSFQQELRNFYKLLSELTWKVNKLEKDFTCSQCNSVDKCLGISNQGDEDKFLNEKGDYVTVSGFSCSDLLTCSTTNLPEGSRLYYTDARVLNYISTLPVSTFSNDVPYLTAGTLPPDYISSVSNTAQIALNVALGDLTASFVSNNISQFTNDSGYTTNTGTVTSVDLSMPAAFSVSGNPITTAGTLAVSAAGVVSQYIRGDGTLATFPSSSAGGSSIIYYLNGSIPSTEVGYEQLSRIPVAGVGTNFSTGVDGYIASFLTDINNPSQLTIPPGNWIFGCYFSANSSGGSPSFYVELYKYDGVFTLLASSSASPEAITGGTSIDFYTTSLTVPSTTLLATDRLAVRIYVTTSTKTITLHTENVYLCQVVTTFSTGITAINGLTQAVQHFTTGTTGTDFNIVSSVDTHTFNLPTASATNRGALSSADWSDFDGKQDALGFTPENVANKATDFTTINNTLYPSVEAVSDFVESKNVIIGKQLPPVTTTSTGEVILKVFLIAANTLNEDDLLEMAFVAYTTQAATNTIVSLIRIGTDASPGVPATYTQIAQSQQLTIGAGGSAFLGVMKNFSVGSNFLQGYAATNTNSPLAQASGTALGAPTNFTIDRTVDNYIYFSVNGNSAGTKGIYQANIRRYR